MSVTIDTTDLAKNIYRLNGLAAATPQQRRRLLERSIIAVERQAKKNAPVGRKFGGTLRDGIGWKVEDDGSAVITAGVKYGRIQEFGGKTKPHRIEPRFAKVLAWGVPAGSPFANAMKFGSGKTRGTSMKNVNAARARMQSGKSVTGMYFHWPKGRGVNHPGSRIKPKHYTRDAFTAVLPAIQADAAKMIASVAGGPKWP